MFPWEVDHLECNNFLKFEKKDVAFNYNTMVIYTCILPISIHIWCGKQRSTNASCTGISLISGASSEYLYLCIPRLNERKIKEKDVSIINTTNVVAADYAQENAYQENTGINDPQNKETDLDYIISLRTSIFRHMGRLFWQRGGSRVAIDHINCNLHRTRGTALGRCTVVAC